MTVSIGSQTLSSNDPSKRVQAPKSSRIRNDKALMWLYENLLTQQLTTKLQCLLSDNEHLTNCYEVTLAFFGSKKFVEALYICLNAFNKKQYDILLQVDQSLYQSVINESLKSSEPRSMTKMSGKENVVVNRRSSDFCDTKSSKSSLKKCDESMLSLSIKNGDNKCHISNRKCRFGRSRCRIRHSIGLKLRKFVSLPDLRQDFKPDVRNVIRPRSQSMRIKSHRMKLTAENLALNDRQKLRSIPSDPRNVRPDQLNQTVSDLRPINLVKCDDIKIYTDRRGEESSTSVTGCDVPSKSVGLVKNSNILPYLNTSQVTTMESGSPGKKLTSNSAPGDFASFFAANGAKIENRYQSSTLFESNASSPLCSHDQCALIPSRGQSLTSYLQEAQRTRRNITDLERENAHFSLSDAIISAIEEIKCSQMERKKEKQVKATSQTKKRKSHQRPLKKWILGEDEHCDKSNANLTDDESSSILSDSITTLSSTSESDLSHISSSSDSSTPSNAGDLKRLKVFYNTLAFILYIMFQKLIDIFCVLICRFSPFHRTVLMIIRRLRNGVKIARKHCQPKGLH